MSNAVCDALAQFPRLSRSILPTPIHRLDYLADKYGCGVYCKRDDMTGFGFGGNKTRKLDFLVAEALALGCDTLIGVGANQSNFCRMAAAYGAVDGLDVHLVLGGAKPELATGNLRLDHLLGATCHHIVDPDWRATIREGKALEMRLTDEGRKVFRMDIGGSSPVGCLGYVDAVLEIQDDEKRLGLSFDAIILTTGSGGMQAGLVAGKDACDWGCQVIGMCIAQDAEKQSSAVLSLAEAAATLIGTQVDRDSVITDDSQLGEGYAVRTEACVQAVELFARKCGVFVDYVYTGKAAAGLIAYLEDGRFGGDDNVLFLHSGGSAELFE
jgi:L-cysteate sulfo-lyase